MSPSNGVDGYLLFSYGQDQILAGVREVGTGGYIAEGDLSRLLELSGLIEPIGGDDPMLSEAGSICTGPRLWCATIRPPSGS